MKHRLAIGLLVVGLLGCSSGNEGTGVAPTAPSATDATTGQAADPPDVDGLVLDVEVTRTAADVASAPLTDDHLSTLDQLGPPDRFVLRLDGDVRQETWHYDAPGLEVLFRDGLRLYAEPVSPLSIDGLGTTPYRPDQFTGDMDLDDVLAVTGEHGYLEQPLDAVDGRLIVVRGLVAGFDDGGLRFVETIPIDLG